jgi:hypothetical protein
MSRTTKRRTEIRMCNAGVGRHADGYGLVLHVSGEPGDVLRKSWLFRFAMNGHERNMGLGPYPATTLAEARQKAADARKLD